MSGIDDIIARSRRGGGGFVERSTFSMSRRRAIKKMREFALADPHFFVLALSQSAMANGATYINIEADDESFCLSYVGGSFSVEEFENLFDFLFVSGGDPNLAHLRELALGINALMLFEPASIVLESGDGTDEGSHRVVMRPAQDEVVVGRPTEPLRGTYLAARGLDRSLVRGASSLSVHPRGPRELTAAEARIVLAPATIPVALNGSLVYGSRADRIPQLWGYESYVGFDEGDLFGSVGVGVSSFRLVTHGCWVQSVPDPLALPGPTLGGVINFSRLRKTADHAAIVQDATYDEMWARVLPYAKQVSGDSSETVSFEVRRLDGTTVPSPSLRSELLEAKRVVLIGPQTKEDQRTHAAAIANLLPALGLLTEDGDVGRIRALAGPTVEIIDLSSAGEEDRNFYAQPPAALPRRPWLTGAVEVPAISLRQIADELSRAVSTNPGKWRSHFEAALGVIGEVRSTVYTPAQTPALQSTFCRVITAERTVFQGTIPGGFCNQWVDIRVPGGFAALSKKLTPRSKRSLAEEIARFVCRKARPQRTSANDRALSSLESRLEAPEPSWMPLAVEGLSRHALLRLKSKRAEATSPGPSVTSLLRPKLLDAKIFRSLEGTELSLHEVLGRTETSGGLVYGRLPEIPAETVGLNTDQILLLDEASEEGLAALLGETDYVRIDSRDELARCGGTVVRDFALGLHDYPDFPLLTEGELPAPDRAVASATDLISQLWEMACGSKPPQPEDAGEFPAWEENRRQAMRHLQWAAGTALGIADDAVSGYLASLPVFIDADGRLFSGRQVLTALQSAVGLRLEFRGKAKNQLGALCDALGRGRKESEGAPRGILGGALTYSVLRHHGKLSLDMDFDLTDEEAKRNPHTPHQAFIAQVPLVRPQARGRLGVTRLEATPQVAVFDQAGTLLQLIHPPDTLGGHLTLEEGSTTDDLHEILIQAREQLAVVMCSTYEGWSTTEDRIAGEQFLLRFAGEQLVLQSSLRGTVVPKAWNGTADDIFALPIFPTQDGYATGLQLVQEFCASGVVAKTQPEYALAQCLARQDCPHLVRWLEDTLNEGRVMRHSTDQRGRAPAPSDIPRHSPSAQLGATIEHWLQQLRVDTLMLQDEQTKERVEVSVAPASWFLKSKAATRFVRSTTGNPFLYLNNEHPLVQRAVQNPEDPHAIAWLLLTAYADINEKMVSVSNQHEQAFQRRLLDALSEGAFKQDD